MVLITIVLSPKLANVCHKINAKYRFEWKKWNIIKHEKSIFTYKNG